MQDGSVVMGLTIHYIKLHRKHLSLEYNATLISFVVAMLNLMLSYCDYVIRNNLKPLNTHAL
jgi:hypothetical protein